MEIEKNKEKIGKWENTVVNWEQCDGRVVGMNEYKCSICYRIYSIKKSICPNCGTKMEEVKE